MSIGTAITIEPYLEDGQIGFIVVHPEGTIQDISPGEWERMDGSEKDKLEALANNSQKWKLPARPDYEKYERKWEFMRDGVDEGRVGEIYEKYLQDVCNDLAVRMGRYFRAFCYFEDERHYTLLASFVIQTFLKNQFPTSPILLFDGVSGSGKSTAMTALKYVGYRALFISDYSTASLVDEVYDHGVTILLDESLRNISSDRGLALNTFLVNGFNKETAIYGRKDLKTYRSVVKNHYTCVAVTTLGGEIPVDLRNRSMMITMALPDDNVNLEEIGYLEDAELEWENHPDSIRSDLYALKILTDSERASGVRIGGLFFEQFRQNTKRRLKHKQDDRYLYGHIHDILYTPEITGRDRAIAYVHYTIGQAMMREQEILEYILDNRNNIFTHKTTTTESVLVKAYAEVVIERHQEDHPTIKGLENLIDERELMIVSRKISMPEIHRKYRELREREGWDQREMEPARTLTVKFKKLRIPFEERGGRVNYINSSDPDFLPNFWKAAKQYLDPETVALFRKI